MVRMMLMGSLCLSLAAYAELPQAAGWIRAGSHRDKYDMGVDATVFMSGKASGVIRTRADSPTEGFGTYMQMVPVGDYAGKRVRLTAFLKTKDVETAALWFRVDRGQESVAFDNMGDRPLKGTTKEWTRMFIVLDVPADADRLAFGVLLESNKGTVWFDDFKFEVVDKTVPLTGGERAAAPANLGFETTK